MIKYICDSCKKKFTVKSSASGIRCPNCGASNCKAKGGDSFIRSWLNFCWLPYYLIFFPFIFFPKYISGYARKWQLFVVLSWLFDALPAALVFFSAKNDNGFINKLLPLILIVIFIFPLILAFTRPKNPRKTEMHKKSGKFSLCIFLYLSAAFFLGIAFAIAMCISMPTDWQP